MNEGELLGWTRGLVSGAGLLAHHPVNRCPSCHLILPAGDPGFPDLLIAGYNGMLLRELKSRTGILSPAQRRWARLLGDVKIDTGSPDSPIRLWDVWRDPVDRVSGRIENELRAIA